VRRDEMNIYSVDDGHGTNICGGCSYEGALRIAQEHADRTGLACLVYAGHYEEVVEPA
jgi:hypothetical protein